MQNDKSPSFVTLRQDKNTSHTNFELLIPARSDSVDLNDRPNVHQKILQPIAEFRAPELQTAKISIFFGIISRDLNVCDIFRIEFLKEGLTLIPDLSSICEGGNDTLLVCKSGSENELTNRVFRIFKDGNRVFCVDSSYIHSDSSPPGFDLQVAAVPAVSFRLLAPEKRFCAEELHSYEQVSPFYFCFQLPAGWCPASTLRNSQNFNYSSSKGILGTLAIEGRLLEQDENPLSIIREFATNLKTDGHRLCGSQITPIPQPPGFDSAYAYSPIAEAIDCTVSLVTMILVSGRYVIHISAAGPDKEKSPLSNAINRRTLELLVNSIKLLPR